MKVITVIGARPQFVKASVVSRAFLEIGIQEVIVNTGQHYDDNMAKVFFDEMGIPKPRYDLGVGSGSHAQQTSASLVGIEKVLIDENPDFLVVYGDTNATIAGALAASKLSIPIAHIESGLRSYNRAMPEEINRIVTDVLATLKFVPTRLAVRNLELEGIVEGVHVVGDVMVDSLITYTAIAEKRSRVLEEHHLSPGNYSLLTIHRPSNADSDDVLRSILEQVSLSGKRVIFPVHPRTKQRVQRIMETIDGHIKLIDPVGYLDMMLLEKNAEIIVTDSGGVQKEAYLHKTPCLTVRNETEWVETVDDGWNILVGNAHEKIPTFMKSFPEPKQWKNHYGDGTSAKNIAKIIFELRA